MHRTVKGLATSLAMLLGALAVTGIVALTLQERAVASHRVANDYAPDSEARTDRFGWPAEPRTNASDAVSEKGRSRLVPALTARASDL
jgi:hypothetical protein